MAYPSTSFPATIQFGDLHPGEQPTDAYWNNGFPDNNPLPAKYLTYIVRHIDSDEGRIGGVYIADNTITPWDDDSAAGEQLTIESRGGLWLESKEVSGAVGGSLVTIKSHSANISDVASITLDADAATVNPTIWVSANVWNLADSDDNLILHWAGGTAAVTATKGLVVTPNATSDRAFAFGSYRSVNIAISPKLGGWTYVALATGGAGNDKQTFVSGLYNFVGESALSLAECSWRRPFSEVEYSSRSTSGVWYIESATATFDQDGGVAFTLALVEVDRSSATETVIATLTVGSGTTSPQTLTTGLGFMLNLQLYTYYWRIIATDSSTSAKRLVNFTAVMRKYAAD